MNNAFSPSAVDIPLVAFHVTCSADAGTLVGMPRIAVREQHDDRHCSELLLARWDHVNFETGEWLIPEGNAKTAKPHIVYMSTQVATMFRELKALPDGHPNEQELGRLFHAAVAKVHEAGAMERGLSPWG
jgi:hypothetical protein